MHQNYLKIVQDCCVQHIFAYVHYEKKSFNADQHSTVRWDIFIGFFEIAHSSFRYLPWQMSYTFLAISARFGPFLALKSTLEDRWLCINWKDCKILRKNHFVNSHFYHILKSNFRPFSGLQHMSEGVQMKGLESYFHLIPVASSDEMRGLRYKAM